MGGVQISNYKHDSMLLCAVVVTNNAYLYEEQLGFPHQCGRAVAFEWGNQVINMDFIICSVNYAAFITMTENGAAETVVLTVIHPSGWQENGQGSTCTHTGETLQFWYTH